MKKYYRKYIVRTNTQIESDFDELQESVGGPVGLDGPNEINGVPLGEVLRINFPIFLTQNIEDLGIYEDVGKTNLELEGPNKNNDN